MLSESVAVELPDILESLSWQVVLESADTKGLESSFDFHAIHNIAKHIIHLKESSSAAKLLAGHITDQHRELMSQSDPGSEIGVMQGVQGLLQHKQTLLENCQVRVQAMDSRAQNMINLVSRRRICTHETVQELIQPQAFNTVNQQDSKVMKSDSQSMKVIAVVTMLFLPAATVGVGHSIHALSPLLTGSRVYAVVSSSTSILIAIGCWYHMTSSTFGP